MHRLSNLERLVFLLVAAWCAFAPHLVHAIGFEVETGWHYGPDTSQATYRRFFASPDATACRGFIDLGIPYAGVAAGDFNSVTYTAPATVATCTFGKAGECSACKSFLIYNGSVGYCPSNSTASGGSCTCNSGYVDNGAGACTSTTACQSTAQVGPDAYFDMGTNPDSMTSIPSIACIGGCFAGLNAIYNVRNALVAGVRHYYAAGFYTYSGGGATCTVGSGGAVAAGSSVSTTPSTCGSGASPMTIGGVIKCVVNSTGVVAAETPTVPTATTANSTVTNGDGSKTVTTTTTNNQTNTTTTSTTNYAAGVAVPVLPTSQTVPLSSLAGAGIGAGDPLRPGSGDQAAFCVANPNVDSCKSTSSGDAAAVGTLYTPDATGKTFAGSLGSFKNAIGAAPVVSVASGFFHASAVSGACTGLAVNYNLLGHAFSLDASNVLCGATAETYYNYIAIGLLLIATGIAFAIAIL